MCTCSIEQMDGLAFSKNHFQPIYDLYMTTEEGMLLKLLYYQEVKEFRRRALG